MSVGPSGVVGVTYRGFNLLHRPLLKRFPVFVWLLFGRSLQCLISALTQAGGGGLLFRSLVPSRCGEGGPLLPLYAAQAPGCSVWSGPCAARGSSPRRSTEARTRLHLQPSTCAFPGPAAQAARSLTCLPIFNWTFVFCCWVLSSLSIFGYRLLTRCMISKYCLRLSLLPFHFVDGSFCCAEAF